MPDDFTFILGAASAFFFWGGGGGGGGVNGLLRDIFIIYKDDQVGKKLNGV